MFSYRSLVILIFLPFFVSCVSLTEVQTFAANSVQALNKVNNAAYSFEDYCQQDCELQQVRMGEIIDSFACNCTEPAAAADKAIEKMHSTITAYLVAVEQLSNNQGFTYDVSGLTEAVQKSQLLRLSDEQVSIATKAGNFIATASTTYYRGKKLKQYLEQADSVFGKLTETFIYLIDNRLRAQLKFEYDARLPNIKQMLDNTADRAMKQYLVKSYLDEKAYYNKQSVMIDSYVKVLKSVQKGHHDLYLHRNNLNDRKTKDIIRRYAQDLQYIFMSLK
jgi:hypothetical protein